MRVLMVCLGNICRSPMAKAIAQQRSAARGLAWTIDSAGTGAWHVGNAADPRTISECQRRGTPLVHTARQVQRADFHAFDLILAMDHANLRDLGAVRPADGVTPNLITAWSARDRGGIIADPYHEEAEAFTAMYDHLTRCIDALLDAKGAP